MSKKEKKVSKKVVKKAAKPAAKKPSLAVVGATGAVGTVMLSITVPTAPVAPTTASDGFFELFFLLIGQFLHIQRLQCYQHRVQRLRELL